MLAETARDRLYWARPLAAVVVLGGCTPNFWSLRSGVTGGEVEGSVKAELFASGGCNDLDIFAHNDEGTALLSFEMTSPIQQMHGDRDRLETIILSERDDFTLLLQTGENLFDQPCYNGYGYYGYYYYYYGYEPYYYDEDWEEEYSPFVDREFEYTSGEVRMHLTARKRRWDYYNDPVHVKIHFQDVTLTEFGGTETVRIPGMLLQTFIYQWNWYY